MPAVQRVSAQRWLHGWRVALRVARREARRAKGRSVLVIGMIMVPVAALAFAAVVNDTFTLPRRSGPTV